MNGDPVIDQAGAVLRVLEAALSPAMVIGVYLYGSAVSGGLRPDSDLDLFVVVDRRLTGGERAAVLAGLLPISGRSTRPAGWRPVELTIVVQREVRPWRYPPRLELQYGEWLRQDALSGTIAPLDTSSDLAVLLTMVRSVGRPLLGPPADVVLDPVPPTDLARAVIDEVPAVRADLEDDTRNVVLTLVRMWSTLATGEIRSKDGAVEWALPLVPRTHRPILEMARGAYLGTTEDALAARLPEVEEVADSIVTMIGALPAADASV